MPFRRVASGDTSRRRFVSRFRSVSTREITGALIFVISFLFALANRYWIYVSITSATLVTVAALDLALKYQNTIGCILAVVMVTAGMVALCMTVVFAPVEDLYEIGLGGLAMVGFLWLWWSRNETAD